MRAVDRAARTCAFATVALVGVATAQTAPAPQTYRVASIADDTVLNVRARPSVAAHDLGDLGAAAGPLEVLETDSSGKWGRILWREGDAWVAMRYLTPVALPRVGGTELPVGLRCAGTEPFWSAALAASGVLQLDLLGVDAPRNATVVASVESRNRLHFPVAVEARAEAMRYTLVVRPAHCTDGMSERNYGWVADLLWQHAGELSLLSGCCALPRRE